MARLWPMHLAVSFLSVALACGERPEDSRSVALTAVAARIDTLVESDSLYVDRIARAVVAPNGHIFVTDQVQRRVVEFDARGRPVRTIGRAGDGPGEFQGPTAITFWGRDSLVVTDLSNRQISVFRRSDGAFLWRTIGLGSLSSVSESGSRLIVASLAPDPMTAAVVIDAGSREVRRALSVADSLTRDAVSIAAFPRSVVAARGHRIVAAVLWSNVATVYDSTLSPTLAFSVPRRLRRDIPPNLAEALQPVLNTAGRLTLIPTLITIEWLADGRLVFIHKDWISPPEGIADPARVIVEASMRAFATVVDLDGKQSCADVELPTDWAENPHFLSDGQTIVGLGHVVGDSSKPTLEYRRFDLRLAQCAWQPLTVVSSAPQ